MSSSDYDVLLSQSSVLGYQTQHDSEYVIKFAEHEILVSYKIA